jgi:hypothetical protein
LLVFISVWARVALLYAGLLSKKMTFDALDQGVILKRARLTYVFLFFSIFSDNF